MSSSKSAIRNWWANAPMTYAEQHGSVRYRRPDGSFEEVELGSRRFFELADEVFYGWNEPLHAADVPFGHLFDYPRFHGRRVLEVGCGMGCMAMNWARQGAIMTAVDLNPTSIAQTGQRFATFGLQGDIREADAEALPFEDASFDFAYSWGVLHHTPGIRTALAELHRVLRPGGEVGVMLYHRHSVLFAIQTLWQEGYVHLESLSLDPLELASRYSDGGREQGNPHTWPVTRREVRRDLMPQFADLKIRVLGTDIPHTLNTWWPGLGRRIPGWMMDAMARRWGWSLWITARKAED